MKRCIVSVVLLTLAAVAGAQESPEVVATINGEVLTRDQFDRMWMNLSPDMRKNYEAAGGKIQFLDNYIRKRLVIQEAMKEGFDEKEEVEFLVNEAMESALFDAYVKMVIARGVVPETEIRALYEERKETLTRKPEVKARHIIATPAAMAVNNRTDSNAMSEQEALEKMKNIRSQLETNPGSFSDLAMQYSEDGAAPEGGNLGWFPQGKMVPEFDEVAFSLEPGEISDVFKTEYGYHIVMVEDARPPGTIPYEEIRGQLRDELLRERANEILAAVQKFTQQLRAMSSISVNRDNL